MNLPSRMRLSDGITCIRCGVSDLTTARSADAVVSASNLLLKDKSTTHSITGPGYHMLNWTEKSLILISTLNISIQQMLSALDER